MVRILKGSHQPKDNLTGAGWRTFQSLKANDLLTVLPADKGNAAVMLMESIEHKSLLFLKKSSFSEEVCQQVRP
jgi:hypothetical protein